MSLTVIIGHGRSPEGRRWGKRIDAADCVIRMWNWEWQKPDDLGTRYDYGLGETHKKVVLQWRDHCTRHPAKAYVVSLLDRYNRHLRDWPAGSIYVDQYDWLNAHGKLIGGVGETGKWELTRGGIAAIWAITQAQPGDEIVMVGFDNLRQGIALPTDEAFCKAYQLDPAAWPLSDYKPGLTKNGNHDFPAEHKFIQLMAARQGVTASYAQDIWK